MFFLGGFNSFIPYLLYLCLIWAVMLIGSFSRVQSWWDKLNNDNPDNIIHWTSQNQSNHESVFLYQWNNQDHSVSDEIADISAESKYPCILWIFPGIDSGPLVHFEHVLFFRGPPEVIA